MASLPDVNIDICGGAVMLTYCDDGQPAMLTARGKDHDIGADDLRKLARAAWQVAGMIDAWPGVPVAVDDALDLPCDVCGATSAGPCLRNYEAAVCPFNGPS